MKKKFVRLISAVLSAVMTLTAVPLSAFAEGEGHTHDGESNVITKPLDFREKKADENGVGWSWDYDTMTLTLNGVNIQATTEENMMSVVTVPNGTEIVLNGNNTIVQTNTGERYTYVLSAVNTSDLNCDGTMTISGNGVLNVENRSTNSMARSLSGTIILNGGIVNATGKVVAESLEIHNDGALNANASATSFDGVAVSVGNSITVDGNSKLTAVGCAIENQDIMNSAILLNGNQDSKISVTGNGSITVPVSNGARYGICYDVDRKRINAEISGKVTAYGTLCGISSINLIMSGTGSVYATGGTLGIDNTDTTIDENEFVIKGSTEFKADESAVTSEVDYYNNWYRIGEDNARTVVIKPDTEPSIKLGKQIGAVYADENNYPESTAGFYITAKNFDDGEFVPEVEWDYQPRGLSAEINKSKTICNVFCEDTTTSSGEYTFRIKCGEVYSNTVTVTVGKPHFALKSRDSQSKYYTNYNGEQKITLRYDVEAGYENQDGLQYNWSSDSKKYDIADLGTVTTVDGVETLVFSGNVPEGSYVIYCDVVYNNDSGEAYTLTERFAFTFEECKHTGGFTDEVCKICHNACDHKNIDTDTGKCVCGHQYVATIRTDGNAPTGYDTLAECLNSVTADTGNYVKIYRDIGDAAATTDTVINVNHNVMVDLNGHKLNNIKLRINKDVTLTLTGTEGSYVTQVYVRNGGSFVIDSDANVEFDTIFVEAGAGLAVNDGAKVTTEQLSVKANTTDDGATTTSVKLATGMKIGGLTYYRQDGSGLLKFGNLLDVTRQALQYDGSGKYVDLYEEFGSKVIGEALTVVEHNSHKYSSGTGKCETCGYIVKSAVFTNDKGEVTLFDSEEDLKSFFDNESTANGTLKLFSNIVFSNSGEPISFNGNVTVDFNGKRFNGGIGSSTGGNTITLENSSAAQATAFSLSTGYGSKAVVNGNILFKDTVTAGSGGGIIVLNNGEYKGLQQNNSGKSIYDMLGDKKAFYNSDGTLLNVGSMQHRSTSEAAVTVEAHEEHNFDGNNCECGFVCEHEVDTDTGVCDKCGYKFTALIIKDGAVASVYNQTETASAFASADSEENKGCTLELFADYSGDYTTLSGEFTLLLAGGVNAGDLTVTGNITVSGFEDSDLEKAEFTVNGGTLVFDENCSVSGTVTVGEGSRFESNSNDIQIALDIINEDSEISLAGGYFGRITYTGGGNRANDSISTLLAPKKAFWDVLKSSVIDGSKYKLSDGISTVTINPHENHAFDSATGKCACGAYCDHSNANTDTGVCNDCGHEFALGVLSDSGNKFYDDADTVFEDLPDGTTVKLYKNCSVSLDSIDVGVKEITVDLNGFTLSGDGLYFETYVGTTLNVIDSKSGGVFNADILVWNNSVLNIGTEDGENNFTVKYIDVTTENGGKLNMYGGVCDTLDIDDYKENIAANINIYGGTIKSIRCGSSTATLNMLLAGGYAFEDENGEIIDAYAVDFSTERENINVTAVKHTHSYSHETGKCACGAYPLAMFTESTTGNISFVTTISELQELMTDEYRDGVIMLTEDISNNLTIKGVKTIDFNGHKFSGTIVSNGNITFANSSSNRAEIAKSVYILNKLTVNGDILFGDNFRATSSSADIVLNSGTYTTIVAPSGKTVLDLLPKGKALAKFDVDGIGVGLYDAGVSTAHEEDFMLKIVAHSEHDFDEHGHCDCGYQCAHSTIDTESNLCKECNAIMRASVTAGSGSTETVKYFTRLTDAFDFAAKDENKGCTVKMLRSYANSDNFELSAGKFTIDLNGFNLIYNTLTVNDGAELTITSDGDSYNYSFDTITVNGGSLAMIGNEAHTTYPNIEVNGGSFSMDAENVTVSALRVKNNASVAIVSGKFKNLSGLLTNIISKGSCVYDLDSKAERSYENLAGVIATNNVGIKRCEHSDVSDSGLCAYCNTQFYEKLSYTADGVEKTEYFESLTEAINKANSVQTATMTILKDTSENYNDNIPDTTGDLTLVLNANTYTIWHIKNGAKLAVSGSGVLHCIIAANGSRVTAAGGVRLGDVTINGEGEIGECSIDILATGGKIADLLADGYAFKDKYGNWLTLEDRAKSNVQEVTVEKAPIASATVTANKTVLYRNGGGARQILFNFNVNTSDEYTISNDNKITVGLYVGDTLINESDFGGNSYTFANANEISDTDGTVKAHLVIKLNGYEYVTNDVEFEMATCTHPYEAFYSDSYGHHCSQCEASIYAVLAKANGDKVCYDNLVNAFNAAQLEENDGCALEVYSSMNRDCEVSKGSFTVKFKEEISYSSAVIKVSGGNVRFTGDDGCTVSKYPLSSVGYLIAVTGGTVTFDNITINDDSISVSGGKAVINSGTYNKLSVSGGTVALNGGTFSNINVSADGKKLTDLLGEKKAFATEDGALFNAYVTESSVKLTVTDHESHDFDEYGYCECGYQCPHDDLDTESNVCRECNAKMYAAVIVKSKPETDEDGDAITNAEESDEAEAKVYYFTKITEAFEFAVKSENEGCTLKMLRDLADTDDERININVEGGKFTLDLNGCNFKVSTITTDETEITVCSDKECTFDVDKFTAIFGGLSLTGKVKVNGGEYYRAYATFRSEIETFEGVKISGDASSIKIANGRELELSFTNRVADIFNMLPAGRRIKIGGRVIQYTDSRQTTFDNSDERVDILKCDHEEGVGKENVNENNRCLYCGTKMFASVSYTEDGADKTEYFAYISKAFDKANSVASATVTMLNDFEYIDDTHEGYIYGSDVTVTGNVTFDLKDHMLGNTVTVADGGKLTLRGDEFISDVIAEAGSKLTVEETVWMNSLTVNGGDVKLSGESYYDNITVNGGKITDLLADGYAFKKGGNWLTLEERDVSEVSGVTVTKAPIKSATLSTEINKLYRNSNANPMLKFNLTLAHGSNLNDSNVRMRYGINSYECGDTVYSSLSALVKNAKLSADEIIDKAGDSDVAKIYYVVTTGDGYEIKSNTVSIDLVDCDHSQVVDPTADKETAGNITEPTYCEICKSKFNAKITKGDDVKYYNDLDEAAKDAQKSENEGCTLYPLYNKNGYGGQLVITEGNFTLKYAVSTAFANPVLITGEAKLTVTGRCAVTSSENPDAFFVDGGDVTFDGLATGSNVKIFGGNVTMASNNINCLTIHGGNVSISSGGFAEIITKVSNKVIADYIDHGFWVQDRGTKEWIDIYSLNKATASSTNGLTVRLCPMQIIKPIDTVYYTNGYYPDGIPSLQISAVPWYSGEVDAKVAYQWIAIDENGYETVIEGATGETLSLENLTTGRYYCSLTYSNATTAGVSMASDVVTATITECEHSGGEATCTNKAKCEICGAEYGETKPHSYAQIKSPEYLKSAATCTAKAVYYTSCADCGLSSKGTKNEATFEYGNALGHKYGAWVSNGDGTHTRVCANDNKHTETKACRGGKATCTAKAICEVCGKAYGEMAAHTFTAKTVAAKYLKSAATCTAKAVYYTSCADCGLSSKGTKNEATFEYGNALGHKYGEWVSNGDGTHSRVCANDSTHTETKACHGGKATCTAKAICEDCGKAYGEMAAHTFTAKTAAAKYLKSAATCTAKAVYYTSCADCGLSSKGTKNEATFEYGNALGHKYGEWVSNGDGTHTRVCANDNKHTETKACHGGKATCTAKAICEDCGKAYGKMTAHTFTAKTAAAKYLKSAATCTAKAVYYMSCADCGLSSKGTKNEATFEYGNALGHKYGKWVSNGDGTHTRVCANDNKHTETKNCHGGKATCTAKAICEDCGKAYGKMTAHTFTAKTTIGRYLKTAATCTTKSVYYTSCADCGLSSKGTASEAVFSGSALGHSLTAWSVTTEATCTTNGSQERHCTRCDYKQTKTITAKGHEFGSWKITKNVSCLEDGEQSRVCSVCKKTEVKKIAATGVHTYGAWKVTKKATCTATGVKERTCTSCGAKEKITLKATGHKYVTSTVKPTYTSKGYTLHKCSVCGSSYKSNYTATLVLAPISGLKRTARTNTTVTLSWNKHSAADGYIVERYNGKTWVRVAKISKNSTTSYTVKSLTTSTTNKFRVKAYKSTASSAYSYVTVNTLPNGVTGFKATSKTSTTVTLSWNKNSSAGGYIIEYYNGTKWVQSVKISGNATVKATVKGIAAGKSNKLRIKAYKVIGSNTVYSAYTQLTVKTKPTDVTGLKAVSKTNNTVKLQWNKNTSADSYIIEKYSGNKWVQVTKISGNATTSYTVSRLKSSTTYRLRIKAVKSGKYSNCTYINVTTKPYAVNAFKAKSISKSAITLQWNKNTSADGYCIEKYNGTKWVQVKRYTSNASTTYTLKSLKAGTTYKFRIRAYKTVGKTTEYSTYTYCNVTTKK